jgi:hypothetical protein
MVKLIAWVILAVFGGVVVTFLALGAIGYVIARVLAPAFGWEPPEWEAQRKRWLGDDDADAA